MARGRRLKHVLWVLGSMKFPFMTIFLHYSPLLQNPPLVVRLGRTDTLLRCWRVACLDEKEDGLSP